MGHTNLKFIDEKLVKERDYWLQKLSGDLALTSVPLDFPRPGEYVAERKVLDLEIDRETQGKLLQACGHNESLVFTFLVTALKIYLHKATGAGDIIVGATIHERYRDISLFNQTLALRDTVGEELTIKELLLTVKGTIAEAYAHQKYPFDRILDLLEIESPKNRAPLFSVALLFENINDRNNLRHLKHDLTLAFSLADNTLTGRLEYNSSLFKRESLELLGEQFQRVLRIALDTPHIKIAELELLSDEKRHKLLHVFNETTADYPGEQCIHELFAGQAHRTPDALALSYGTEEITYSELNARANQLARHLLAHGIRPGSRLAIFCHHSPEMLVAVLATLKAGAAYLPLDPAHPAQRLSFMLADAKVSALLTTQDLRASLPSHDDLPHVLSLDADWPRISTHPAHDLTTAELTAPVTSDLPAYIIYTSGSTGQPKGVVISHHSLVNYIHWAAGVYLQGRELACALYSSLAFDLTVTSIFMPLITGNRVIIFPTRGGHTPVTDVVADERVGLVKLTPSHLSLLVATDQFRSHSSGSSGLRCLIVGGEAFETELARQAVASFGSEIELYNEYGPTEATVGCMIHRYSATDERAQVPIGRPAANTQIYVLDEQLRPVAENVEGDLYIGGAGLAVGYFDRAELTAERFLANPFAVGARLYRSGDRARHLPGGIVEYLGRRDEQVKYHGYRVELGELRAALNAHPQVRDSVVAVRQDEQGRDVLVGYYVARQELNAEELRAHLRERVYEEVVPGVWVRLRKLPLTLNGKVNYEGLPGLAEVREAVRREYEAPQTAAEEVVAGIWGEVLGVSKVGAGDNFFELGGHSLLATQVISRVREAFGVDVPLRALFEARTVRRLSEKIETELKEQAGIAISPILPVGRDGELPLSFAQQRLWFIDQLQPESSAYNVHQSLRLTGDLNIDALERALSEVVRRHEVLHTNFTASGGRPVQVIRPAEPLPLPVVHLAEADAATHEREILRLSKQEAARPFDLAHDALLRVCLLRLHEREHVLLLTVHHIISDEWSWSVLVREVAALYRAFAGNQPSPLPELKIQYADFAAWQRQWLQNEVLREQLAYWKKQLGGKLPVLDLPTARPRPLTESFRGAHQTLSLPLPLTEALKALSQREGVTLFMTLLSAFETILQRYTGQDDIMVGAPIANRNRIEIENLIGFFVNTLVLRTDLSGDPTFKELLGRVREVAFEAYAHQDLPFEKLVEELQPERDLSRTPLFQVVFSLQNAPQAPLELPGVTLQLLGTDSGTSQFDWVVNMWDTEDGLVARLTYNTDLFDAATVERLLQHFECVLDSIVANPDEHISALPLLTAADQQQLLVEWNHTAAEYPGERCIHDLFAAQASRTPDALALSYGTEEITYSELNARANQLARHLLAHGIRPGSRLAIFCHHSPEMLVAVLATLKAGAAYLPLDPAHPAQRLSFMLADAKVSALLTTQDLRHVLPAPDTSHLVMLDADWPRISTQPAHDLTAEEFAVDGSTAPVTPDLPAYIIYTSGSTGQPKGVVISHRSLVNYIHWAAGVYLQGRELACALYSSLAFDLTVTSIFMPLITGNRVIIFPTRDGHTPVTDVVADERVGLLKLTPSHLSLLVASDYHRRDHSQLRCLIVGGEAFETELARHTLAAFGTDVELYNEYGPTEATVGCMIHRYSATDERAQVPIGRPAANTQIYVLDEQLRPVAENVEGDLYIGGAGLAVGYFDRAELTAERFLANPFAVGARLYRSGDRARHLPGGIVEYLGRRDEQVKYHGYRVELGELRAALNTHPQVRDSVVAVRQDEQGRDVLVGYYVARQELNAEELRAHLRERVYEEVVPGVWVRLRKLPLTLNGKVNYEGLPGLAEVREAVRREYEAPQTAAEEVVAGIWGEVLGVSKVGAGDNFFELGGHSLLATQVISRVREAFGVDVPLRALFENRTVARLARHIDGEIARAQHISSPPILSVNRDAALPLSFAQQRLWFLNQLEPHSAAYNIPAALRLTGALDSSALERSLSEIVRRHEALRTTFVARDGEPTQIIQPAQAIKLPLFDLSQLPVAQREQEAQQLLAKEASRPFDLATGPLLRAGLIRLSAEEHVASLTMHHIISDGWSIGALVKEVRALYEAYSTDKESPLAELPIQYADYAVWQREWLQGAVLDEQLSYWRRQLRDAPAVLELPTDRPRPRVQSYRGAHEMFEVSAGLTNELKALCRREGVTLFMTLLAAWKVLLHRYTGQDRIPVGSPVANRGRAETHELIACFINTVVLHTDLSGNPDFHELMRRVREVTLEAYAHQDLPFEVLVEALAPERKANYTPLFQVWFVFQNAPLQPLELPGLTLKPLPAESRTAQFDVALSLQESEQGIEGHLDYNTDLFNADSIVEMQKRFILILEAMIANPGMQLLDIPLGEEPEYAAVNLQPVTQTADEFVFSDGQRD
nr:condensation domain-containing protein [uncultured bacterium]